MDFSSINESFWEIGRSREMGIFFSYNTKILHLIPYKLDILLSYPCLYIMVLYMGWIIQVIHKQFKWNWLLFNSHSIYFTLHLFLHFPFCIVSHTSSCQYDIACDGMENIENTLNKCTIYSIALNKSMDF